MRAARIHTLTGPADITCEENPEPVVAPDGVDIEVHAAGKLILRVRGARLLRWAAARAAGAVVIESGLRGRTS